MGRFHARIQKLNAQIITDTKQHEYQLLNETGQDPMVSQANLSINFCKHNIYREHAGMTYEGINMLGKQTVLVTGGNGFIGTNLVHPLMDSGQFHVLNLDTLTYAAIPLPLVDLAGNSDYESVKGKTTDGKLIVSLFEKYQPAGTLHLAAESHVDRSIVSANDFVQTKVYHDNLYRVR